MGRDGEYAVVRTRVSLLIDEESMWDQTCLGASLAATVTSSLGSGLFFLEQESHELPHKKIIN